jgi:hypothetical protein
MRVKVLFLMLPIFVAASPGVQAIAETLTSPRLSYYISLFTATDINNSSYSASDFLSFVEKFENRKHNYKSEKQFLADLFTRTHHRFLKNFKQYASFRETLTNGTYNCLTGTALYALLLDHFGYDYTIIETNYHVFLIVKTDDSDILFEATDPARGFVDEAKEIEKRIDVYKQNKIQPSANGKAYQYSFALYNTVSLDELLGLFHYNQAIEAYNKNLLSFAITHLDRAARLYTSPRIEEFSKIVLFSVVESELESSVKANCVRKIEAIRKQKLQVIANDQSH